MTPTGPGGTKVAVLTAPDISQEELREARSRLEAAGVTAVLVPSEVSFESVHPSNFGGLVLLDSASSAADDTKAMQVVREFMVADKPVAAIGKGVSLLIAADAVGGRSVAAPIDLQDTVKDAGGSLAGTSIQVDDKLITARSTRDLHVFLDRVARAFASQVEERQIDQMSEQSFPASDPPPGPGTVGGPRPSSSDDTDARF